MMKKRHLITLAGGLFSRVNIQRDNVTTFARNNNLSNKIYGRLMNVFNMIEHNDSIDIPMYKDIRTLIKSYKG